MKPFLFRGCYGYAIILVVKQTITRNYYITQDSGDCKKILTSFLWDYGACTVTKNKLETFNNYLKNLQWSYYYGYSLFNPEWVDYTY